MGRSQETFNKKEVRQRKEKKRKEKAQKRLERKENEKSNSLDDMIAYVDENGVISSTPPDPNKKTKVKAKDIVLGVPSREDEDEDVLRTGVVSHFNHSKGFGFIKDSVTKQGVFFHINQVTGEIAEGNQVQFEVENGPRGLAAVNVTKTK